MAEKKQRKERKPRTRSFKQMENAVAFHKEDNCCGVIAVALATGRSFGKALGECTRLGRAPRSGTATEIIEQACANLGNPLTRISTDAKTVASFAKTHDKGLFLVLMSGGKHIGVVRDGKVIDHVGQNSKRKLVDTHIWEVQA